MNTRASLAASCRDAGLTDEAIELEEQVLAGNERILGPQHPDTLAARANLAASYHDAGRGDEAVQLLARGARTPGRLWARSTPTPETG
ncbi:tetratricopeptide repeat protein [Streptomyces sp. NPDC050504]|uniref:tetratricopeptide repeat protein n=1 Tax=Streptomyces sp. NPDC050504 TaxID=3365618 RepID=UPI00379381EF